MALPRQRDYDEFTYIPNFLWKIMGYDFLGSQSPKPLWHRVLLTSYLSACLICLCYMIAYIIIRIIELDIHTNSLSEITRYAQLTMFTLNSNVKFFVFVGYRKRILNLNAALRRIYPTEESKRRQYNVNKFYWPRVLLYVITFYVISSAFVVFLPYVQSIVVYLYHIAQFGSDKAKFSYMRYFPMRYSFNSNSPLSYTLAIILELWFSLFMVNSSLGVDLWMMCLSGQICMHFAFLARTLEAYKPTRKTERQDCGFLASVVNRHQYVFALHNELNNVLGVLLAYNWLLTSALFCCSAIFITVRGVTVESVSYIIYLCTAGPQFYMVCSYGHQLIERSESIGLAAYTHNWYDGTPTYRKFLLLIIQRAQRPATLSAKGVVVISLHTFQSLINLTYRFFALIRQMINK